MAAGEFLQAKKTFQPDDLESFDLDYAVKQIQTGDTNTVFAAGEGSMTPEQRLNTFINYLLNYGKSEFHSFRRIRWQRQFKWQAARQAIESTYDGVATVVEHQKIKDEKSKLTNFEDRIVLENQPCKLSFKNLSTAKQSEAAAAVTQTIELFISPDITIKPGSKITVTQAEVTTDYTYSGVPAVYDTHQQIILDLFTEWA